MRLVFASHRFERLRRVCFVLHLFGHHRPPALHPCSWRRGFAMLPLLCRPCMSQIRSELQAVVGCRDALLAPVPPSGSRLASPAAASAAPGSAPAHDVCQLADLIPLDIADASGASGTQAPVASTGPTPLEHPDGQGRQHAVHDVGPLANPLWQVTPMQPAAAHLPAPACPTPAPPSPGQAAVAGSRSHATTGNPFSQGWSSTRPSPSASIPGSAWNLGPGLPHLCSANPSTCSLLELPPAHPSSLDAWAPANLPLPTTGYPGCVYVLELLHT